MSRRRLSVVLVGCAVGCASPPPAAPATATVTASAPAASAIPSAAPVAGPPKFEVHEWGLVDVDGGAARVLGGPHGHSPQSPGRPVRKPVLYFHLNEGTPSVDAMVRVELPAPGVQEYFPTTGSLTSSRRTLEWSGLHVRKGACHYHLPRESNCNASDGCETPELPNYETDDSACIESGKDGFNLLFYRGSVSGNLDLPYVVTDNGASVSIRHAKGADIVGPLVYVHHDAGDVYISVIAPPDLGKSIEVTPPKEQDTVVAQRALDQAMREVGLSSDETAAFNRAWSGELYGLEQGRKVVRRDRAERDVILYTLPASMIDGIAKLTIEPAPTSVKRFLLVRYEL
ncbi:MAG: hypothetical protein U0414_07085 [Polyangiaceae bacterium]